MPNTDTFEKVYTISSLFQVLTTKVETFVWWEGPTAGRGEWRYSSTENGALFPMAVQMHLMLLLFADNLAMTHDVSVSSNFGCSNTTKCGQKPDSGVSLYQLQNFDDWIY